MIEKICEVEEYISNTKKEIERLSPLLTKATSFVLDADKQMKDAQNEFLNMKHVCEQQHEKIKELRIPCEKLQSETNADFDKVLFKDITTMYKSSEISTTFTLTRAYIHK